MLYEETDITEEGGQLSRSDGLNPRWKLNFTRPKRTRKRQRPSVSRLGVTEQHLQILGIKSLKYKAQDRNQWLSIAEVVRD